MTVASELISIVVHVDASPASEARSAAAHEVLAGMTIDVLIANRFSANAERRPGLGMPSACEPSRSVSRCPPCAGRLR